MKPALLVLAAAPVFGCAWEPGHGFARLSSVAVSAHFEPTAADVTVQALAIDVSSVELEAVSSAAPVETEHEHEHGEEEAAAGDTSFVPVVTIHVDQTLDSLTGTAAGEISVEPSRELPLVELRLVAVTLTGLRLRLQREDAELSAELPLDLVLGSAIDFDVDRDAPEKLDLVVEIEQTEELFAGLDWATLAAGSSELTDADDPLAAVLIENLHASGVHVSLHEAR